jgi:hypothetical protein
VVLADAWSRARPQCRFVLPLVHFRPDSLTDAVPLCLSRQCDRTPGSAKSRGSRTSTRRPGPLPPAQTRGAAASYRHVYCAFELRKHTRRHTEQAMREAERARAAEVR